MGGGNVSAIADRIAGRDLDREAIADRMYQTLEVIGALGSLPLLASKGVQDVEFRANLGEYEVDSPEEAAILSEAFDRRLPIVGSVAVGMITVLPEEETEEGDEVGGILVFRMSAVRPENLARQKRVPRSRILPNTFRVESMDGGCPVIKDYRDYEAGYWAPVGRELWCANGHKPRAKLPRNFRTKIRDDRSAIWECGGSLEENGRVVLDGDRWQGRQEAGEAFFKTIAVGLRSLMVRRFNWSVSIGHPGCLGSVVECSPEGARALFADRNVVGGKRRTALRHWVKEHYRRGHTPEESHKVREHLRGIERFTWHGLDVKLQVPSAEIEAAGLLARSGR